MLSLICTIISGAFVGWIAGKFMKEDGGFWKNAIIGIVGSVIGRFISQLIGFQDSDLILNLACNILGACLFIYAARKIM